jgi:hypothetical protein
MEWLKEFFTCGCLGCGGFVVLVLGVVAALGRKAWVALKGIFD